MVELKYKSGKKIRNKSIREIESKVTNSKEHRFTKFRTKVDTSVFQIVWGKDKEIKHLHCKSCDNHWKHNNGSVLNEKFVIEDSLIKCKKCSKSASYS